VTVRYDERFQSFAIPGLALLVLGMLLMPSSRRRASS
jgi:Ca-activated chloride channel family protein